ncbi:ABC transporter permease [Brevibacterium sp. 50QC2O2]|jgi:peptide/nickel transport system permease protein|uniref:ABC transporter permease n=1 Tax=Brevibacterium sp. 50QC2O2 TaxID=2968459 RepID=UPI00211C733B|nr:ABC transporter permease [Brevibacterium sp. 50QC2O2]MCQ9388131.1 ABC transporter permease [Brevibacterium sp. 50QC2O2]
MANYLLRRLLQALFTIFAVVSITFVFGRIAGNPAAQMLPENASPEQIAALSSKLGFDRPYFVQYLDYLGGILHGDFQDSYRMTGRSSMGLVLERLPVSLHLGLTALALGLLLAFAAVLVMQYSRSRWLRSALLTVGSLRASIPDFFFGLILVLVLSVQLGLLPSLGNATPQAVIMPAITIATAQFVVYMRLLDSSMTEESGADYVRTAYARGENPRFVMLREVMPNAVLPVLTVAGMNLGAFLGGLVLIENVFAWPGLGQLIVNGVYSRDFPVVQSGLIMVALLFVLANILVDFVQAALDPRVRLS